jgi:hypothetical protein
MATLVLLQGGEATSFELTGTEIPRTDFEHNLADKLNHRGFRADLDQLLAEPPADYDIDEAAALVRERLVALLD